jgi:hypothetical protein
MIDRISIQQYREHLAGTSNIMSKAMATTLFKLGQETELEAKKNVIKNFTGRNNYTLSGALLNSIYNRFEKRNNTMSMYIGSKGVKYARIHEMALDGKSTTVRPVNAKFLWVRTAEINKKGNIYRRLSPSDFYMGAKNAPALSGFYYATSRAGKLWAMVKELKVNKTSRTLKSIPLFALRKSVKIPARPYLMPALMKAKRLSPIYYAQELYKLMSER